MARNTTKYYKFRVIYNGIDVEYFLFASDIVKKLGIPRPTIYWKLKQPDGYRLKWQHISIERCNLPVTQEVEIKHPETVFDEVEPEAALETAIENIV